MVEPQINWRRIEKTWNGAPALAHEVVLVGLESTEGRLVVHVDAPFHDDPPPAGGGGRTDRLWEYEVVEVFLLGAGDRYLELEIAPERYLFLEFSGSRKRIADDVPEVRWSTQVHPPTTQAPPRWSARLTIPKAQLPPGPLRWNAFAAHGRGDDRRLLALHPSDLQAPDFHALRFYAPLPVPRTDSLVDAERPAESTTRSS